MAWEQGRLIGEDGRKPDGNIPKIPQRDITQHDVDRTIGLRNCDMMKLADAILANEVSMKSNKLPGDQQREGVTLQDWCQTRKRIRIVMNELMVEFRGKDLPSKKKEYVAYTDNEWDDLAKEKNLSDETLKNIVVEVEKDKPGLDWLEGRGHALAPMHRDTDPAPSIYVEAVAKFAKVVVRSANGTSSLQFRVKVAASLKDALAILPAIERVSKPKVVVIFLYYTHGESLYVRPVDVVFVNAQILREDDDQGEDAYSPPRRVLKAPVLFICDSAGSVNVQAFAANSQTRVWSAHRTTYLSSTERCFRKSVMDPRPVVHLIHCYPTVVDQREEFHTFSEFSGIKKELDPCWDESVKAPSEDWAGGKCGVALPLLKQALLLALKKYDCRVVNIWGGGNITALALVSPLLQKPSKSLSPHPLMFYGIGGPPIPMAGHQYSCSSYLIWQAENREVLEIVCSDKDVHATHLRVSGMNFIPDGYAAPPLVRKQRVEAESQLVVSTAPETDTQPPSPAPDNDPRDDNVDDDEPSTPREDVIRTPPPVPAPQLQTLPASRLANVFSRKSKSLQVNIREPPSQELIQRVVDAFNASLPSSPRRSAPQRRPSLLPSAPTQEDLPQEELSPLRERRTKLK